MCDTLVSLTDDGVLFAKNSDRDPNEAQVLRWYAAAAPDAITLRCTWSEIDQVPATYAVLLSQPWWMWGAEMGANEHGVVIGNEAVFTRGTGRERSETGLLGMDLLRLGLERGATAQEAVEVIVDLLERHGQGGSCSHEHPRFTYDNSFIIADPNGAIVLETAGRHWATETVTGRGRSISNGLTIPGFAEKYADPVRGRVAQCATRRGRTQAFAEAADDVAAMWAALRDHGGAGPDLSAPPSSAQWSPVNGALAAPCAHAAGIITTTQSTASWVADLRDAPLHWVTGTSAPCTSIAKPVRVTEPAHVDPAAMPTNTFDPAYRWWRHEQLHRLALRDHGRALGRYAGARDRVEKEWFAEPPTTADAFAAGDRLEEAWLEDLVGAGLAETRPGWLRWRWRALDRSARMPR
jgi:secernin